jgi:hypothetical protein
MQRGNYKDRTETELSYFFGPPLFFMYSGRVEEGVASLTVK